MFFTFAVELFLDNNIYKFGGGSLNDFGFNFQLYFERRHHMGKNENFKIVYSIGFVHGSVEVTSMHKCKENDFGSFRDGKN